MDSSNDSQSPLPCAHPETLAIHRGQGYKGNTGAVIPPVYLTSTFEHGNPEGFDYTRSGNPNFRNLNDQLAALEKGEFATVFGSGVAAITAIISTLKSGDLVLAEENVYGCTYRLLAQVFEKFGVKTRYVDFTDRGNWELIEELAPALVWIESPTNPLLKIIDIQGIAEVTHRTAGSLVVDNTFASSILQHPLELGADLSLISTTKYTNGHSDVIGGAVCSNDAAWQEKMVFAQKALGLQPSPFDSWLVSRGAKTEALRVVRHSENALALATWLESEAGLPMVRYPFLDSHPQCSLARQQMTAGGGIVIADLEKSVDETVAFLKRLRYFTMAESLGGIESLVCHPASMTHASVPREVRESVGITDSLVRFSVGIEHIDDLIADVKHALGHTD